MIPRQSFNETFVKIRKSKKHWSITVPKRVREILKWEDPNSGFSVPGVYWIDVGMRNGTLVLSVYDPNVKNDIDRLKRDKDKFSYL